MSWKKLEISVPDLNLAPLDRLIALLRKLLDISLGILRAALAAARAINDPIAALLEAIITEIEELAASYLNDLGGYVLHVPVPKRLMTSFAGIGDITPAWATDAGIFTDSGVPLNATQEQLEFMVDANRYNGGNAAFYRTVVESLYDLGDANRPQFDNPEDYVGGFTVMMGASGDLLGFLDDLWKFSKLFGLPDPVNNIPGPSGLIAKTMRGITEGKCDVFLSWDPPRFPITSLVDLGGINMFPSRYAIIRGKNTTNALSATSVVDLFGTRDLKKGTKTASGDFEVIEEGNYDVTRTCYTDTVAAETSDVFYYTLAWKLKAFGSKEAITASTGTEMSYWPISNVERVVPIPVKSSGTPPDWRRTASIAEVFPPIRRIVEKLLAVLRNLAGRIKGGSSAIEEFISFLEDEIDLYSSLAYEILDELAMLKESLKMPTAGMYVRSFSGKGGNAFLLTDLAMSLAGSEVNTPPFHAGDEYVTGMVVMAGGRKAKVESFMALLEWLFGSPGEAEIDTLLQTLSTAADDYKQAFYNDDMSPTDTLPKNQVPFDPALCPLCVTDKDCSPAERTTADLLGNLQEKM